MGSDGAIPGPWVGHPETNNDPIYRILKHYSGLGLHQSSRGAV